MLRYCYGESFFKSMHEAYEHFDADADDRIPETIQRVKAMRTSEHIDVDSLVDGMLERLTEGECGADEFCTEDGSIAEHATDDEIRMLKGFVTLWLDNLKFKMYTEDMDAEPVPFKADFLADRARKDAIDLERRKREGARAVEEFMREQQAI
jgi:hypothetical protein